MIEFQMAVKVRAMVLARANSRDRILESVKSFHVSVFGVLYGVA